MPALKSQRTVGTFHTKGWTKFFSGQIYTFSNLIVLKFIAKLPKPPWKERMASKSFDIPKMKDPIVRQQFNEHLDRKLSEVKESWSNDVDADWSLLSSVIQRKDWFDECGEQASKRRAAEKALHGLPNRNRAQQRAADEARENYKAINR
jgi:hypothetical protein